MQRFRVDENPRFEMMEDVETELEYLKEVIPPDQ